MTPLDALQQQNRRRLIIGGAACAAILVITGIAVVVSHLGGGGAKPAAAAVTPSETWTPLTWAPETSAAAAATTEASPTLNNSCTDAQGWAADGEDSLLDGFINNQTSGNINGDELKTGCPQYLPAWQRAQGGIGNGETFAVPDAVKPGIYETTSSDIENCYWERSRGGRTVDNNFITGSTVKQRVTIRSGDDTFITRNCGDWVKVG